MISPATLDVTVQQNATFSLALQFKDSTGVAMNMTGYSVAAQIWSSDRASKFSDLQFAWTSQSTGQFTLTLAATQTGKLGADGVWDLLVTNPDGTKDYWLRGKVDLVPGYTQ